MLPHRGVDPWLIYYAIVALYVALIVLMVRRRRALRAEVAASRTWPAAASRVVESRLDVFSSVKGGTTYFPTVVYEYAVGGRGFRGNRTQFGEAVGYNLKGRAERRLAVLAAAAAVQVYHDPADPVRAVIERSAPVLRRDNVLLGILVLVLAGLLALPMYL